MRMLHLKIGVGNWVDSAREGGGVLSTPIPRVQAFYE